ncbi:MAG: MutS protein msh4 [Caeruleum heppii]|nr:MAG: MutS protein msh4 [Caeruleum heppii]
MDDSIEANVSTFAAEMRETAFILRNIDKGSIVIIDELGRGTSTRDGIAIALSIAEALVESRALVWFATHFRDLARIMAERSGVVNLHLTVEMTGSEAMTMLYTIADGCAAEEHYGLKLARLVDLPPKVLDIATEVSATLRRRAEKAKQSSQALAVAKRRRLILGLKETLIQARDGSMANKELHSWLKRLQEEFVNRMSAIDAQAEASEDGGEASITDDAAASIERTQGINEEILSDTGMTPKLSSSGAVPASSSTVTGQVMDDGEAAAPSELTSQPTTSKSGPGVDTRRASMRLPALDSGNYDRTTSFSDRWRPVNTFQSNGYVFSPVGQLSRRSPGLYTFTHFYLFIGEPLVIFELLPLVVA